MLYDQKPGHLYPQHPKETVLIPHMPIFLGTVSGEKYPLISRAYVAKKSYGKVVTCQRVIDQRVCAIRVLRPWSIKCLRGTLMVVSSQS